MKRVILTGYEPFGEYKYNPTRESTELFRYKTIPNIKVIGIVLPRTYYSAYEILSVAIDKEQPHAIISTSLCPKLKNISIETTFHNVMNGKYPDENGEMPDNLPILDKLYSEPYLMAKSNGVYLANILQSNDIPVSVSIDAGSSICNSLGYLTTHKIMKKNYISVRNLMIRIPWTDNYKDKIEIKPDYIFLEQEKYYHGLELLIKNI